MTNMKAFAGAVAISALLAACSDGGSQNAPAADEAAVTEDTAMADESAASEEMAAAEPAAEETAEAATADAPAGPDGMMATKDGVSFASLTGDAAAGKVVFAQCRACHVVEPGVNRVGPSLAGIIGRTAGSVPDFNYSPANKNSGLVWTPEQLFVYLEDPQRVVPKTKMLFPGLKDAQNRADVIAYLQNPT